MSRPTLIVLNTPEEKFIDSEQIIVNISNAFTIEPVDDGTKIYSIYPRGSVTVIETIQEILDLVGRSK